MVAVGPDREGCNVVSGLTCYSLAAQVISDGKPLRLLACGDFFGEIALTTSTLRMCDVVAQVCHHAPCTPQTLFLSEPLL